jgi:hypothetical protein
VTRRSGATWSGVARPSQGRATPGRRLQRNDGRFYGRATALRRKRIVTIAELVEAVKISSWKWWMSRASAAHCLLYEWRMEPRLCMLS